jgi:hypothetical protein
VQTGGFGLGAKTPFSYSDSFNIVTWYNGVRYNYACFIDETKIGKLSLLSESPTKEPNGTEIIIPVQSKDFRLFEDYTEQSTRHWKVKPIVKPYALAWRECNPIMSDNNWSIVSNNHWNRGAKLIVDEIEYPVDMSTLRSYADSKIIDSARGDLYLYFGVGELSLSASREQIYLDEPTKKIISNRLKEVSSDINRQVQEQLNDSPNFFQANVYYRTALQQSFSSLSFLSNLSWKCHSLISGHNDIGCSVVVFSKVKYNRRFGVSTDKISRSTNHSFVFTTNSDIYINDLGVKELTTKHVKKAFENDPALISVQVVCPNEKSNLALLNENYHLDEMQPKLLSSIAKVSTRAQRAASSRLIVFKFDHKINSFRQTSYAALEADPSNKILCLLRKDHVNSSREVVLKDGQHFPVYQLRAIGLEYEDYSFYGIDAGTSDKRIAEDFNDFGSLNEFLNDKILSKPRENYVALRYLLTCKNDIDMQQISRKELYSKGIKNRDSLFLKRINLFDKVNSMASSSINANQFINIYEGCSIPITEEEVGDWLNKHPEMSINSIQAEYEKKYPLLNFIDRSYYKDSLEVEHIIDYINLVDAAG